MNDMENCPHRVGRGEWHCDPGLSSSFRPA